MEPSRIRIFSDIGIYSNITGQSKCLIFRHSLLYINIKHFSWSVILRQLSSWENPTKFRSNFTLLLLLTHDSKQNLCSWGNEKISALVLTGLSNNVPYVYLCFFLFFFQKNVALSLPNVRSCRSSNQEAYPKNTLMSSFFCKVTQC